MVFGDKSGVDITPMGKNAEGSKYDFVHIAAWEQRARLVLAELSNKHGDSWNKLHSWLGNLVDEDDPEWLAALDQIEKDYTTFECQKT